MTNILQFPKKDENETNPIEGLFGVCSQEEMDDLYDFLMRNRKIFSINDIQKIFKLQEKLKQDNKKLSDLTTAECIKFNNKL